MVDAPKAVLDFLLAQASLTNVVERRIYAEVDSPPAGYKPADGPAICLKMRGGGQDYESAVLLPSMQFKIYGESEAVVNAAYRALCDALNDKASYTIKYAMLETLGQTLREPGIGWIYVLVFFSVMVANQ